MTIQFSVTNSKPYMLKTGQLCKNNCTDLKAIVTLPKADFKSRIMDKLLRGPMDKASKEVQFFWTFLFTKLYPGLFRTYKKFLDHGLPNQIGGLMKASFISDEAMILTILDVKLTEIMQEIAEERKDRQNSLEEKNDTEDVSGDETDAMPSPILVAGNKKKHRGRKKKVGTVNTELGRQEKTYLSYYHRIEQAHSDKYQIADNGEIQITVTKDDEGTEIAGILKKEPGKRGKDLGGWYEFVVSFHMKAADDQSKKRRKPIRITLPNQKRLKSDSFHYKENNNI